MHFKATHADPQKMAICNVSVQGPGTVAYGCCFSPVGSPNDTGTGVCCVSMPAIWSMGGILCSLHIRQQQQQYILI